MGMLAVWQHSPRGRGILMGMLATILLIRFRNGLMIKQLFYGQ